MAICDICGQPGKTRNIDGVYICKECFSTVQRIRNDDIEAIAIWIDSPPTAITEKGSMFLAPLLNKKEGMLIAAREQAAIDRDPDIIDYSAIRFHAKDHLVVLPNALSSIEIPYDDIVDYELLEDGAIVHEGGIGRAVVGGLIAGGAGAIVGSTTRKSKDYCTSLAIKITARNRGAEYATFINSRVNKNTLAYKTSYKAAQDALSQLLLITEENKKNAAPEQVVSKADEILKLKELLDAGAIDQEEFTMLKQRIITS